MVFGDLEKDFDSRIKISRIKIKEPLLNDGSKNYSPNKAYWFIVDIPDTTKTPPWSLQIRIFNERDYLICIVISNFAAQYETKVHWINDKLMYVQFWWGRISGAYLIFDVEKERIVLKEGFTDGETILQQWKEKGK
ncbi:MAG: hypothetical protein N3A62_03645 [Thermodesulfovibrionales bacterium]|nr:hypothetical protein [Thermodesulfovibrionales bacterium]